MKYFFDVFCSSVKKPTKQNQEKNADPKKNITPPMAHMLPRSKYFVFYGVNGGKNIGDGVKRAKPLKRKIQR